MEKQPESHLAQAAGIILSEGDAKFRIWLEMIASAIFVFQDTRFKYVNPATEYLTGYTQQELLGMNFYDVFPPGAKKSMRHWGIQVQRGEISGPRGDFAIIKKNGEEKWIDLSAVVIEYEGKPAVLGMALDCTERKRTEILYDIGNRISQAADRFESLKDFFTTLQAIISEIMPATSFCIALKNLDSGLVTFPYVVDDRISPGTLDESHKGLIEYVFRTRETLLCDMEKRNQLEQANEIEHREPSPQIWLGVPFFVGDNEIGLMAVQNYDAVNTYGIWEQRALEFISSRVAAAISRKRSEDGLREDMARIHRRSDDASALYETIRDIATQRDARNLLQTLVDRAASLLNAAGGSIYLLDDEHDDLKLVVAHGSQELVGTKFSSMDGFLGQVMQTLYPVIVDDYHAGKHRSSTFDALSVTAIMAVPMLYSGELVGVLSVNEVDTHTITSIRKYTGSEMQQLMFFAGAAASAVHNLRLFEETRQRLVELEVLYQASLSAAQIHSLHAVAQRVVDTLENLLNWNCSIWLIEENRPVLLALSTMGLTGRALKNWKDRSGELITSLDDGIIGWVCKNGRSFRTGDVKSASHYTSARDDVQSEVCVPLKVGGKTIGCFNVESVLADAYSEHDERLLNILANQTAVAIENARLFDETKRRSVRQVALNSIISASTRSGTSLDEILNIALEQTLKALDLDMGAVWLSWSRRSVQRVVSRGIPSSINILMVNAVSTGDTFLNNTVVMNDCLNSKNESAEMFLSIGIHSFIAVPLNSKEDRIGGIAIASSVARQWMPEEVAMVETIGREVGLAAERARLFEETSNRINELEAVNKVSTASRLAQSLEGMLPQLVDETLKALDTETGGIWLYDLEHDKLHQTIGRGWCLKAAKLELERGNELLGGVLETGDIYFSQNVAVDLQASPELRKLAPTGWSAVCVPIRTEQETIGIFVVSAPLPREFTGEDARLLVTLTEIAGNAIHRVRLNEKTILHAADLETRVTERTAELQAALQKAQAADRLKSEFIANINHELRTPLTNLILYYQMLRAQPTIKTEERLGVIGRELQRLRNLIEDLLNLSRLDLGQVTFSPLPCDLNGLIQTLINDRKALAVERGLILSTELQPDLEPVNLDEPTIAQVVSNLLTNAMNYTPSGGNVLVKTLLSKRGNELWAGFSVLDNGMGINDDDVPHLFERFYRGKAGRQSGAPGTGLGLAIVKQVVEHHHGRIEVQNGPNGRGAIFTVWLPVKQTQETK